MLASSPGTPVAAIGAVPVTVMIACDRVSPGPAPRVERIRRAGVLRNGSVRVIPASARDVSDDPLRVDSV